MLTPETQSTLLSVAGPIITTIGLISAVVGWFIVHYLSKVRDRKNKQRDLRTTHLINAYREIFRSGIEPIGTRAKELENAIGDIQLFGTSAQINLAQKYCEDLAKEGAATLTPLVKHLRNDLRSELNLESADNDIKLLKIEALTPSDEALLNVLFGELSHAIEHFTYAVGELQDPLPYISDEQESLRIRLIWSKYGGLATLKILERYGFLSKAEIALLLQLSFRIRNCDTVLERLLVRFEQISEADLSLAEFRMDYVLRTTKKLIDEMESSHPEHVKVLNELKAQIARYHFR